MNEKLKTLGFLVLGAGAAGVYLELAKQDRDEQGGAATSASSSASAAPASSGAAASAAAATSTAIRPAESSQPASDPSSRGWLEPAKSRARLEATVAALKPVVKTPAGDPSSPWALAHGLIAFGKDFAATDGRSAVDIIGGFAEPQTVAGATRYQFPSKKGAALVEPHPVLLTKTLVEVGVPLDREITAADGTKIRLERLVVDALAVAQLPAGDKAWRDVAWLLSLMASTRELKTARGIELPKLAQAALERNERDSKLVRDFSGSWQSAFEPGSPLFEAKSAKKHIYGHHCGGLHFAQGVLHAAHGASSAQPELLERARSQLDFLVRRFELESPTYERYAEQISQGDAALLIRVQRLKFYGHIAETLGLARELKIYDPKSHTAIERVLRKAAMAAVETIEDLMRRGAYGRLAEIRSEREQTYLDLVGDACHAVRGLRRALPAFPSG